MSIKTKYVYYQAKNNSTGLTDVTANIFKDANGGDTAVASAVALAEVDATNAPGLYALELSAANLTLWGGAGTYSAYINSVSKPAPATAKIQVLTNDEDDIYALLTTVDSKVDTVISNQGTMQSDLTSVKGTVESTNTVITDVTVGNANLKALLDSAISAINSVQNNTRFVAVIPTQLIVPDSGSNTYLVDIRIFNTQGDLEDPDTNQVAVSVKNEAGLDRTNLLVGYTSGPVDATRISKGNYQIEIAIGDTAAIEQLTLEFDYTENAIPLNYPRTTRTVLDADAAGFALQSTLLDVLADTSDMQPRVVDIQTILNSATFGNAALKALIDVIDGVVDSNNAELTDGTYGLSALKTILDGKASQASVTAITTILNSDIKGAGFDNATDSLKEISDRTFTGGKAF